MKLKNQTNQFDPHFFLRLFTLTSNYETIQVGKIYNGVCFITIKYIERLRSYYITESVEAATNFAESRLKVLLRSDPEKHFDCNWLLKFCKCEYRGDKYDENEKEIFLRDNPINIEAAAIDFKSSQHDVKDYIVNATRSVYPIKIYYRYNSVTVWEKGKPIASLVKKTNQGIADCLNFI